MRTLVILFMIGNAFICKGQDFNSYLKPLEEQNYLDQLDDLEFQFGSRKKIPAELKPKALIALSFFPELKDVNIEIKYGEIRTSMSTRPKLSSLFFSRKKRKYFIFINSDQNFGIPYHKADFSAQVGCLSHEFSHIVDYSRKSALTLIFDGVRYVLSSNFRKKYEMQTDTIAIQHHVGYYVYEYAHYVFYESNAPEQYLKYKRKSYFTPEEILAKTQEFFLSCMER